ncbi:hypothetical protein [Marinobacter sp. JSM 1782161]|uniref:hypothetical protein n=1 Tax=Marinobacter sp. JSM 1782161 TaxID=2685906 RepID=UPI00140294FB|nr:hypothetical protein [Marinobacter sp. JSM 1782161]
MDAQSILTLPQKYRRTFVVLLIALFTIALLLDWKLSTLPFIETLLGYIRAIAAAIITSLFLLWVVSSFIPRQKTAEGMAELEAGKITKEFDKLLSTATRWRYKGNFGRYMRGKVLPALADR